MTATNKTYAIRTIADIFDKVPTDRIGVCMDELKLMLQTTAGVRDMLRAVSDDGKAEVKITDELHWIDDGKGDLVTVYTDMKDQHFMTMNIKTKERP